MAAGEPAVSLQVPNAPASDVRDGSSSNMSSPLSDVEDKDGDSDSMELDGTHVGASGREDSPGDVGSDGDDDEGDDDDEDDDQDEDEEEEADGDDDSNLSEVDVNDSEAETERLHDSPLKRDAADGKPSSANADPSPRRYPNSRNHTLQSSPSKRGQQTRPLRSRATGEGVGSTSGKDDESDSESSVATSARKSNRHSRRDHEGPPKPAENRTREGAGATVVVEKSGRSHSDTRKRKRSPAIEQTDRFLSRKRTGAVLGGMEGADDTGTVESVADDVDGASANPRSGDQSDDADSGDRVSRDAAAATNGAARTPVKEALGATTRSKRIGTRKHKDSGDDERGFDRAGDLPRPAEEQGPVQAEDLAAEVDHGDLDDDIEGDGGGDGDGDGEGDGDGDGDGDMDGDGDGDGEGGDGDIDMDVDGDGDPEASHKDEEQIERRKAAWEFIHDFERSFAKFREQYYEERLRVLDEEEAMLMAPEPTHPDFLAMMQCVDARRDETQRIVDAEYRLNQESLHRWAVARRAQILSQYYQSVRDSRDTVLEELGNEWYRIQQQRRRHANNVPDFGLPFPSTRPKAIKQAVAYNKEVSILSGIAKHRGFPAAPDIMGATSAEIEDDLDEIAQARNGSRQAVSVAAAFPDYGAVPNERSLGPAGEEFLKQTPWANPNHPSHHMPRPQYPHSHDESHNSSPIIDPSSRRPSHPVGRPPQPQNNFGNVPVANGSSPSLPSKPGLPASHDATPAVAASRN